MSLHCKKISLLISAILVISTMAGCRARHFPVPPPPIPRGGHYDNQPHRVSLYRYRYFPREQVYYDSNRNIYFYFSNNVWLSGPVLPRHIHIDINNYVTMELEGPNPHLHHKDVTKRYPQREYEKERRNEERREEKADRRDDKRDQRQEYRGENGDRRDDKRDQRQEYRGEKGERRDDKKDKRKKYRDENDEEQNNTNGERQNDQEDGRGSSRPGWR
ncbi:MAG: hypothetical protein KKD73_05070 [Proteobacteria bacterium]|nr:hypothetical protein [Pseudomonadota bacterium]MBU1639051.1 hypothetical protein [Pseudomonadota bacterium]